MSSLIDMCISFPWLAPLDAAQPRKKGGKKTQGVFFRAVDRECARAWVWSEGGCWMRSITRNHRDTWQLSRTRRASVAMIGRRSVPPGSRRTVQQPGRERPPSPETRLFPAASQGVAHVPAASLRYALDSVRLCCTEWSGNSGRYTPPFVAQPARIRENEGRVILTERSRPCL